MPLSFTITIIFCTKLVFKLHVWFFCTDGSRGGALEVRDFKKRAKEGMSYMLSSLCVDRLVYETKDLTSSICIYVTSYQ